MKATHGNRAVRVGTSTDDVRRRNLSSVLTLVHRRRAISRAELTRHTGLSRSTTKDLVEELVAKGLVRKNTLVKVLGDGKLTAKVDVTAHKFSGSAREAITSAGGSATEL